MDIFLYFLNVWNISKQGIWWISTLLYLILHSIYKQNQFCFYLFRNLLRRIKACFSIISQQYLTSDHNNHDQWNKFLITVISTTIKSERKTTEYWPVNGWFLPGPIHHEDILSDGQRTVIPDQQEVKHCIQPPKGWNKESALRSS